MEFVLAALVLAGIVALVVLAPLRRAEQRARVVDDQRAALEAAKEQKYRDIRDAELDYRMGKLSEADWRAADRELRAQAIEVLRELDALNGRVDAREAMDSREAHSDG
jgi:ribosomal protein S6